METALSETTMNRLISHLLFQLYSHMEPEATSTPVDGNPCREPNGRAFFCDTPPGAQITNFSPYIIYCTDRAL